ncbi:hypothetical protein [Spongiactinospora gelatinilytica]|uniref:hypothetical protein n=1 Tax=Spongiactinospora gelatinilytica TaxID=2666298 RepID=UPI001314D38E|nr:hypothetical protein [Spongiactinospora gelatinilytica]
MVAGNRWGAGADYWGVHNPNREPPEPLPGEEGSLMIKKPLTIVVRRKKTRSRLLNNHG